jgi:hypothetical protein
MTMPEQLYLPQQLIADETDAEALITPAGGPSWPQRLLAKLIVLRTRQARIFLESRGYVREHVPGERYRRYRLRQP